MPKDHVSRKCNLALKTIDGRNAFGRRVWRLSGSRHVSRIGVPTPIIKLLARWASDIIDHYLKDVPLERLTAAYREGMGHPVDKPALLAPVCTPLQTSQMGTSSSASSGAPPSQVASLDVKQFVERTVSEALRPLSQLNEKATESSSKLDS